MSRPRSVRLPLTLGFTLALGACAHRPLTPANPVPAPVHYEMEPIEIEATKGAAGVQIESYDAEELFEQAGAALSQNRYDDAVRFYDKLLSRFADSSYARPSMYNKGLALRDKKDWPAAVEAFKAMAEKYPTHADSKDALFQLGACYAELANWPASGEVFVRLLERQDLTADDRVEAMARRGFAQFNLGDLDAAEKTFRATLAYKQKIETEERLATDFYLAFSQYHLGEITHRRFTAIALRPPEGQMERDLDQKASLLLQAQRAYIDTIKYGNPAWASAAGFQVGSLYEELYDAFMSAPVPSDLDPEARQVYREELHKKIRVLLEKSVRWYRENLLMVERLGVNTDWAEKSKLAYAKLMRLLDPTAKPEDGGPLPVPHPAAPATPAAPQRAPSPTDHPQTPDDSAKRQIL
jgi:tetratricopeptide (TPR) repeat protein